jgi:hypothetical protein
MIKELIPVRTHPLAQIGRTASFHQGKFTVISRGRGFPCWRSAIDTHPAESYLHWVATVQREVAN